MIAVLPLQVSVVWKLNHATVRRPNLPIRATIVPGDPDDHDGVAMEPNRIHSEQVDQRKHGQQQVLGLEKVIAFYCCPKT